MFYPSYGGTPPVYISPSQKLNRYDISPKSIERTVSNIHTLKNIHRRKKRGKEEKEKKEIQNSRKKREKKKKEQEENKRHVFRRYLDRHREHAGWKDSCRSPKPHRITHSTLVSRLIDVSKYFLTERRPDVAPRRVQLPVSLQFADSS